MATLDTTPLKTKVLEWLEKEEKDLTLVENEILNELVEMFSDFDARFVQYPFLVKTLIGRAVETHYIDCGGITRCLEVFIAADRLSRRGR